jgi:hypothetical protein
MPMTKRIRLKTKPSQIAHARNHADGRHGSRVTSGKDLLPNDDGRSKWARLMKATYRAIVQHLGGDDVISDTQRMAARRLGALEAELTFIEDRIASIRRKGKEPPDSLLKSYASLATHQLRLQKELGWKRHQKTVKEPDDLASYLRSRANGHARNGLVIEHGAD